MAAMALNMTQRHDQQPETAAHPARDDRDLAALESPCFGARLHQQMQIWTEAFTEAQGEHFVTLPQYMVLDAIKGHDSPSQTDLVRYTGIDRSTLADIVRRLVQKHCASRRRTKEDARAYAVKLTPDGIEAWRRARDAARKIDKLRPQILGSLQRP